MKKKIVLSSPKKGQGQVRGVSSQSKNNITHEETNQLAETSKVVNHDPSWDKSPAGETVAASQEEHNFLNKASDNSPHHHDDEKPLEVKKRNTVKRIFEKLLDPTTSTDITIKGTRMFLDNNPTFFSKNLKDQVSDLQEFFISKGISFDIELPTAKKDVLSADMKTVLDGQKIVGVVGNPGQHLLALQDVLVNTFPLVSIMDGFDI